MHVSSGHSSTDLPTPSTGSETRDVEFLEVTINMPDAPRTYHVVKGRGQAVVKALVLKAKEKGVAIRVASPVKQILKGRGDHRALSSSWTAKTRKWPAGPW